jgi:DNA invertase Pin-like site-specific DNA recombinase
MTSAAAALLPPSVHDPVRTTMLRLVAYLRVSTDRQAESGFGIDVQDAAVRSWARHKDHRGRIVATCTDEGRSGSTGLLGRPGLAEALGHLHAGRADAIVVARLDRLARDLVLSEWLRAEVVRMGCQLRSADPVEDLHLVEDPDNPTGKLVRQILGAIAEYERDMIRLRMASGKAAKASTGGYVHGRPPYGWRAVKGALVRDEAEQLVVARIRRTHRLGRSLREIATSLNESGLVTRSGSTWTPVAVSRVVERLNASGNATPRALPEATISLLDEK